MVRQEIRYQSIKGVRQFDGRSREFIVYTKTPPEKVHAISRDTAAPGIISSVMNTLIVFGATGDLAGRLLLPAVAAMRAAGSLGRDFRCVGVGQQDWSPEEFTTHARARLSVHAPGVSAADRDGFLAGMTYRQADVTDPDDVAAVLDFVHDEVAAGPVVVYLALPTQLLLGAIQAVQSHGLPFGSRLAVEKPLGYDGGSAAEINDVLADIGSSAGRSAIYRVDHALAMTAVQTLPRAYNPGTNLPIQWDSRHIEQIDLLFEETLALEGRASFYDRAGALRDVMQNHLLQMLATLAQPPATAVADAVGTAADRRAAVLRAVRPLGVDEVLTRTRRARYTAGRLSARDGADGRWVPDYGAEDGVDPSRNTETFAEVVLEIDTPQWVGTRFVLRAGKALDARRRGVLIRFRSEVETGTVAPDPVWLDIDEIRDSSGVAAEPAAYQRIVADLLSGESEFAVSAAEVELAWELVMPVLRAWSADEVPMRSYPAGSRGPAAS
jgi:glucose-6-phosphate 1-dehydrogenase